MFNTQSRELVPTPVALQPFDISLYATEEGLRSLQNRFSMYLRGLSGPARFVALQTPANLSARIHYVGGKAGRAESPVKRASCTNTAVSTRNCRRRPPISAATADWYCGPTRARTRPHWPGLRAAA